ncbi:MAG: hypothetical protein CVV27_02350 [Candidatus Melainabacteria bacterium HGW-Melainabacteria-1]|nr:MAG: hypothetical protein CVV27_02350 [Candidatus Melainabacteria bacterium HGW-Melainabacteria-1]
MKLKKPLILITLILLLAAGGLAYLSLRPLEIRLQQGVVLQALAPHFPLDQELLPGLLRLSVDVSQIKLEAESNRVLAGLSGAITAAGRPYPGSAQLSFGLEYEPQSHQLFLTHPRVESFAFAALPAIWSQSAIQYLLPLLQNRIERVAVYQLPQDTSFQLFARRTLKDLRIEQEQIVLTFGI